MPLIDLNTIEEKEFVPGFLAKFIHSENMTIAYLNVKAGASFPEHSHLHEQIANVIEGEFELTFEKESVILTPGKTYIIPSNVKHSGKAITNCKLMDVFNPVREDYKFDL